MFSGGRHLWFFRRPLPSFLTQDHTSCRHGFQNTETSHEVIFRNASSAGTLTCVGSMIEISILVTGRNEVVAKVIFLHLFVILFTGGLVSHKAPRQTPHPPDQAHHPPRTRHPPPDQAHHPPRPDTHPRPGTPPPDLTHPPRTRHTPPPHGSRLRHTVYERSVRILLECILVIYDVCLFQQTFTYSKQKHEILFQKVKFSFKKILRDESIKNSTLLPTLRYRIV